MVHRIHFYRLSDAARRRSVTRADAGVSLKKGVPPVLPASKDAEDANVISCSHALKASLFSLESIAHGCYSNLFSLIR
jgi:hypothetical protein